MVESDSRHGGGDTTYVRSSVSGVEMRCSCYENDDFGE